MTNLIAEMEMDAKTKENLRNAIDFLKDILCEGDNFAMTVHKEDGDLSWLHQEDVYCAERTLDALSKAYRLELREYYDRPRWNRW